MVLLALPSGKLPLCSGREAFYMGLGVYVGAALCLGTVNCWVRCINRIKYYGPEALRYLGDMKSWTGRVEMSQVERKRPLSYRRENGKGKETAWKWMLLLSFQTFETAMILTLEMVQSLLLYTRKDINIVWAIIRCKSSCFCLLLNPLLMSHF